MSNTNKKAIQAAVYKATSPKDAPGKEKHIRTIVAKTFQKDGSGEEIIRALQKRLDKSHWAVVLKALVIFHRCFKDGDPAFLDSLKQRSGVIFALRKFSTPQAQNNAYTLFVKKYAKYLEEKVSVVRMLSFQFEVQKDLCKGIKPPKSFKVVPKIQSQLNALLNCKMRSSRAGINNLVKVVYILLLQDSLPLYSHLNDGIASLMDLFWKMPKKDAARVVDIYKLYVKETDALAGLYDVGRRFVNKLPPIQKADSSIIDQMETYVTKAPAGEARDDDDDMAGMHTNMSFLMSNPGHKGSSEDDAAPAGEDSSGASESSEDEPGADPFASFMTGTSFAGFNFTAPTFFQPQYPVAPATNPAFGQAAGVATNNPFATNTANPFSPAQPANPFATANPFASQPVAANPFANQHTFVGSNPGFAPTASVSYTGSSSGFAAPAGGAAYTGSAPGFGNTANPFGAPVAQPLINPNPFQPAAAQPPNPFATNNPFLS